MLSSTAHGRTTNYLRWKVRTTQCLTIFECFCPLYKAGLLTIYSRRSEQRSVQPRHDMRNAEAPSSHEQGDDARWKKRQRLDKVQTTQCSTKWSTKVPAQKPWHAQRQSTKFTWTRWQYVLKKTPKISQGRNNIVFDQILKCRHTGRRLDKVRTTQYPTKSQIIRV